MKKMLIPIGLLAALLTGCEKMDIVKTYEKSEDAGITVTYYEIDNGTWQCDGVTYPFRLELSGRMHNAESDSYYTVLTDNKNLTFEDVKKAGMKELHLSVEKNNEPSVKTIIRNGGVFERSFEFDGEQADIYRIAVNSGIGFL